jgi:hypothetical protein
MAKIESIIEPNSVLDYIRWKSVSFVQFRIIHSTIVAEPQLTCQYPPKGREEPITLQCLTAAKGTKQPLMIHI